MQPSGEPSRDDQRNRNATARSGDREQQGRGCGLCVGEVKAIGDKRLHVKCEGGKDENRSFCSSIRSLE